jgi:hypothetical protein
MIFVQTYNHAFGYSRAEEQARSASHVAHGVKSDEVLSGRDLADFVPIEVADAEEILKERDACGVRSVCASWPR